VAEESDGLISFANFPGGALNRNPVQQVDILLNGVADIAWTVLFFTPGRFPDNEVFDIPGLVTNSLEGSVAITRLVEAGALRGYDDFHVLGIFTSSPISLHATYPVESVDDMQGRNWRAAGTLATDLMTEVGAVPVSGISSVQIAEALSRGVIDGTATGWDAVRTFRVDEVADHHVNVPMGVIVFAFLMNRDAYDALSEEARAVLDANSGEAFAREFGTIFEAANEDIIADFIASEDHTLIVPEGEAMAEWQAAFQPAVDAWLDAEPGRRDLYQTVQDELEAIRAE
jgi:TRAP-type C4-dicarboxylate transport system substrate-binding protein